MKRAPVVLLMAVIGFSACGPSPSTPAIATTIDSTSIETTAPTTVPTVPTGPTSVPTVPTTVPNGPTTVPTVPTTVPTGRRGGSTLAQPGPGSMHITYRAVTVEDGVRTDLGDFLHVDADPHRDVIGAHLTYPEALTSENPARWPDDGWIVEIDSRVFERGGPAADDRAADPTEWRLSHEDSLAELVPVRTDVDEVAAAFGVAVDDEMSLVVAPDDWPADPVFSEVELLAGPATSPIAVHIVGDGDGRVASFEISYESDRDSVELQITVTEPMQAFEVPDAATIATLDRPARPLADHNGEYHVRVNNYLEPIGVVSEIVLTPDGTLLVIDSTDVFSGPEAFRAYRLSDNGIDRWLAELLSDPLLVSDSFQHRYAVSIDVGGALVFDAHPDRDNVDEAKSRALDDLIERLAEPDWLGRDLVGGPEPWVPSTLTLFASEAGDAPSSITWPFAASIDEMSVPSDDGERVVCLVGDDVATFWRLLSGQNHAHLPIDDGSSWDVTARINWPGYRLVSDPCV